MVIHRLDDGMAQGAHGFASPKCDEPAGGASVRQGAQVQEKAPIVVCNLLPPSIRDELAKTPEWHRHTRAWRIDVLTLQAHLQFPELVRHPQDVSRLAEWALIRYRAAPDAGRIINEFE